MDQTGASIDKAKEWIGDVFVRVGNSFRERRTQLVPRNSYFSSFYGRTQYDRRRNTDPENHTSNQTYLDRLKSYCISALGGNVPFDNVQRDSKVEEGFYSHSYNNTSLETKKGSKEEKAYSIPCQPCNVSVSLTNFESMLHSYYSKMCNKKSENTQMETVQTPTAKKINTNSSFVKMSEDSTDSGVCFDFAGSIDEPQFGDKGDKQSTSNYWWRENDEKSNEHENTENDNEVDNFSKTCYIEESHRKDINREEKFSRNYSVFCEKLDNIQHTASFSPDQNFRGKSKSFSCHYLTDCSTKQKGTSALRDIRKTKGIITISLQHFQKSRQLRIVLLSVESSVEHGRKMFCKVTLTGKKSKQKEKSRKIRSQNGNGNIKETFYMDCGEDLNGYVLKLQLRTVSRILKRQTVDCEAYVALETIDIDLDTTLTVKLRDPKSINKHSNDDTVEIKSENRSIHAEVTALLHGTPEQSNSQLVRHLSLPQIRYDSVTLTRHQRTMTYRIKDRSKTAMHDYSARSLNGFNPFNQGTMPKI